MGGRLSWFVLAAALAVVAPSVAAAQPMVPPPIPSSRLVLSDLTVMRLNPTGLETQARFGYQRKIYDADESLALRDNFWFAGTYLRFSPASVRTAAMAEVQPLSLLNLRFTAEYLHFYGNFTFLQSRPDAGADLSDDALKDNETGPFGNYSAGGVHVTFEPMLQAKVGPVAVRDRALFGWFDMDLRAGDRVWYEATLDTAVPGTGWVVANDLDVIYVTDFGLNVGTRFTSVLPQYTEAQNPTDEDNSHHRLGLLAAYTFFDEGYTAFNKPTAVLISSWYLKHRYRAGQEVSRAMPYVILGFAFQTDLMDVQ